MGKLPSYSAVAISLRTVVVRSSPVRRARRSSRAARTRECSRRGGLDLIHASTIFSEGMARKQFAR